MSGPPCPGYAEHLGPMMEDRLEEPLRGEVEAHVETCDACQAELARLSDGPTPGGEVDTGFLDRLRRAAPASAARGLARRGSDLPAITGFHLIREVGRGGMGTVYEATELALGRRVALKVVPRGDVGGSNAAARFRREARSAAGLHHTNIVPVFGVGEDGGYLYYAMQFIDGEGLDRLVERMRHERPGEPSTVAAGSTGAADPEMIAPTQAATEPRAGRADATTVAGPAPGLDGTPRAPRPATASGSGSSAEGRTRYRVVARIGLQVAEALAFAHRQGILHRDVKPSNVLIDLAGAAWVADFGLAKTLDGEGDALTRTGDIVGTLRYMAPERFDGLSDVRGDVYALGVTLYELLTLRPVFEEANRARLIERVLREEPPRPRATDRRLPRDLETIVLKAMAKEPPARYPSAGAMAEDLRLFLAGEPIRARRSGPIERTWRWARRNPTVAALAASVVLATTVGFSLTFWKWREAAHRTVQAVAARGEANRLAADLLLDRGLGLLERGDAPAGRLWLARSLDAPEIAPGSARVARLNLAAWDEATPRLTRVFRAGGPISRFALSADGETLHAYSLDNRELSHHDVRTGARLGSSIVRSSRPTNPAYDFADFVDGGRGLFVTGGTLGLSQVFDAATGEPRGATIDMLGPLSAPHFDPRHTAVAVENPQKIVRVWDLATGRRLGPDLPTPGPFALSPGGRSLLSLGPGGGTFREVATGRVVAQAPGMSSTANQLGFDLVGGAYTVEPGPPPAGSEADAEAEGHRLRLWGPDGSARGEVGGLIGAASTFGALLFGPDGRSVAAFGPGGSVVLVDLRTAKRAVIEGTGGSFARSLAISPDGSTLAVGTFDGKLRLWDARGGQPRGPEIPHGGEIVELSFTADGSGLAVLSAGSVNLWHLPTRPAPADRPATAPGPQDGAAFSPGAERALVYSYRRRDLRVARPEGPSPAAPVPLGWASTRLLASPDGRRWAAAARGGEVPDTILRLLDADGAAIGGPLPHRTWLIDLAFSPDGRTLAATGYGGALWTYDAQDGRPRGPLVPLGRIGLSLDYAPDGRTVVVGTGPNIPVLNGPQLQRVDAATGKATVRIDQDESVMSLAHSPDGRSLLVRYAQSLDRLNFGRYRLWDVATFAPRGEPLAYPVAEPRAVAFLPGGGLLTPGPGGIWTWDVPSGRPLRLVIPLRRSLRGLAVDPPARWVAALTDDGRGQLYEAETHRPIGPPLRAERPILAIRFDADGRSLVAALDDATLRRWPLPTADAPGAVAIATGARLDPSTGAVRPLSAEEWLALAERDPPPNADDDAQARHALGAEAAESEGDSFAALWHLDRLAPPRPGDWTIPARRAEALAAGGRRAEADEALAAAAKLAPAGALRSWELARAADDRDAGRAEAALWHLDHRLAERPDDVPSLVLRSEIQGLLGRADLRDADIDRAAALGLEHADALRYAERRAADGRWAGAAALLALAEARRPDPSGRLIQRRALAALHAADPAGYRDACARMLAQVGPTAPAPDLNNAAYLCALAPGALADYSGPIARLRAVLAATPADRGDLRHVYLNTLGALLLRAGDAAEAVARLEEGVAAVDGKGVDEDWIFLALADQALGRDRSARERLAYLANERIDNFWERAERSILTREVRAALP